MLMKEKKSGSVKAKYISDIPSINFTKGQIYDVYLSKYPQLIRFYEIDGEEYALPADRFEIIEETPQNNIDKMSEGD